MWLGSGTTPAERSTKFLTILAGLRGHHYPLEGTTIVAAFPNPDSPMFTRIIIKVSELRHEPEGAQRQMGFRLNQSIKATCSTPVGS